MVGWAAPCVSFGPPLGNGAVVAHPLRCAGKPHAVCLVELGEQRWLLQQHEGVCYVFGHALLPRVSMHQTFAAQRGGCAACGAGHCPSSWQPFKLARSTCSWCLQACTIDAQACAVCTCITRRACDAWRTGLRSCMLLPVPPVCCARRPVMLAAAAGCGCLPGLSQVCSLRTAYKCGAAAALPCGVGSVGLPLGQPMHPFVFAC